MQTLQGARILIVEDDFLIAELHHMTGGRQGGFDCLQSRFSATGDTGEKYKTEEKRQDDLGHGHSLDGGCTKKYTVADDIIGLSMNRQKTQQKMSVY